MKRRFFKCLLAAAMAFLLCLLSGCAMNREIQEIKLRFEDNTQLQMYVCWPETSDYGVFMQRIVNNYNLTVDKQSRVQLSFSENETEYLNELRKMTATMTLPDVFVILDNPNDAFLQYTTKLMDISALESEAAALKNDDRAVALLLVESELEICVHEDALSDVCMENAGETELLRRLAESTSDIKPNGIDIDELIDLGEGLDYFSMLLQADDGARSMEHIADILPLWKNTLCFLGEEGEWYDSQTQPSTIILHDTCLENEPEDGYVRISELTNQPASITGNRYFLAASAKRTRAQEERVLTFLQYVMNYARNRLTRMDSAKERLLAKELAVLDRELINEHLREYANGMCDETTCAEEIAGIIWKSEIE